MSSFLKGLLGIAAIVVASGCSTNGQRECNAPPPPPPPPPPSCCCGGPGNGTNGPGMMMQHGGPGGMHEPGEGPTQGRDGQPGGPQAGGPGGHFGPSPEAFEVCKDKKLNDSCKVERDAWVLNGTCTEPMSPGKPMSGQPDVNKPEGGKDARLVCAPPRPNAPPGGDSGKPASGEKPKK